MNDLHPLMQCGRGMLCHRPETEEGMSGFVIMRKLDGAEGARWDVVRVFEDDHTGMNAACHAYADLTNGIGVSKIKECDYFDKEVYEDVIKESFPGL